MATLSDALRGYTPQTNSPMTDAVSSYVNDVGTKFNENQIKQMEMLQKAFPDNTLANADPKVMAEIGMQAPITGMTNIANRKDVLNDVFNKITGFFKKPPQLPEGVIFDKLHPFVQKKILSGDILPGDAQWMSDYAYTPGSPLVETGTGAWKDQSERMQNFVKRIQSNEISKPAHWD